MAYEIDPLLDIIGLRPRTVRGLVQEVHRHQPCIAEQLAVLRAAADDDLI